MHSERIGATRHPRPAAQQTLCRMTVRIDKAGHQRCGAEVEPGKMNEATDDVRGGTDCGCSPVDHRDGAAPDDCGAFLVARAEATLWSRLRLTNFSVRWAAAIA